MVFIFLFFFFLILKLLNFRKFYFYFNYLYSFVSAFFDRKLQRSNQAIRLLTIVFNSYKFSSRFAYFFSSPLIFFSKTFVFFIFVQLTFVVDQKFSKTSKDFVVYSFYNFFNVKITFF